MSRTNKSKVTKQITSISVDCCLKYEDYRIFRAIAERSGMSVAQCVKNLVKLTIDDELKENAIHTQ